MMKKVIVFLIFAILIFCAINMFAQMPGLSWAKQIGSSNATYYRKQATDYFTGTTVHSISFNITTDVDPGPGVINFTGAGGGDIALVKVDVNGNTIWAKQVGGIGYERADALVTDNVGNIYVTGFFNNTVDFDPGAGVVNLAASGPYNGFILKLDSNGNFIWVQQIRNSNLVDIRDIKISASGIIVIAGIFDGTIDLDPGVGTFNATAPTNNYDVFIATYTSSAGAIVWADVFPGTGSDIVGSIDIDPLSNEILYVGNQIGTCDWDPGVGVSNLVATSYSNAIVRLNILTGALMWAKMFTGPGSANGLDIAADYNGNIWVTGNNVGTVDFDPGAGVFNLSGPGPGIPNSYMVQLNSAGDLIRALRISGASDNFCNAVAIDRTNNWVYLCGGFKGTADFDPGPGTYNVNSVGNQGWYIIALDDNGNFQWGGGSGGDYYSQAYDISTDVNRNIYVGGHFYTTVDFDPGVSSSSLLTATGLPDVFFLKLSDAVTLPVSFLYFEGEVKNKMVELDWATASEINNSYFTLERSSDGLNFSLCGIVPGNGNASQISEYNFMDASAPKGIVYYLLSQTDFDGTTQKLSTIAVENDFENDFHITCFEKNGVLKILSTEKGEFQLQIISMNGQVVYSENILFGSNDVELNSYLLIPGVYILNVKNERKLFSTKFVW
ncbi:MAG: T9SS type A sorting domain-containing protein [Bacteroidia bacterium]|nr:T9SS type A sorting domain-containing protein [Bacteroidia bacterium]